MVAEEGEKGDGIKVRTEALPRGGELQRRFCGRFMRGGSGDAPQWRGVGLRACVGRQVVKERGGSVA